MRDAAKPTAASVIGWWSAKAGIPTKSANAVVGMIENMHKEWTKLYKQRAIKTQNQIKNRKDFLELSQLTFWAPKPNCDSALCQEDRLFLQNMKSSERKGGIGVFDRTGSEKVKRKEDRNQREKQAIEKEGNRRKEEASCSMVVTGQ